jgi:mRNA interferase RelE/StbE
LVYNIVYKKSVHHDLRKLSKTEVRRILDQIEHGLTKDPVTSPVLKGRFAGLRKLRIGDYRIIYAVLRTDILILRIGHRRDVNKKEI